MILRISTRRTVSILLAGALMMPALSVAAEAAVGTWLAPKAGEQITARSVEIAVGFNTQSELRVTRLELWVDGKYYARKDLARPDSRGVGSFWWDTSRFQAGQHDLIVKIFAGNNLISTVTSTATVGRGGGGYDLLPPTVKFTGIKSGDVLKGNAGIKIDASDDSGDAPIVSLLVDNALKLLSNNRPYSYTLDTTKYTDGSHELRTFAYDSAGNKSDPAVVKVQFRNGVQQPVVASVSVAPGPGSSALREDYMPRYAPPVAVAPTRSQSTRTAARASSAVPEMSKPARSIPIAKSPRPVPVVAPKPVVKPLAQATKHTVIASAAAVAAPVKPQIRTASVKSGPASSAVAEPRYTAAARSAEPTQMAMASAPTIREQQATGAVAVSGETPVQQVSEPVLATPASLSSSVASGKLKLSNTLCFAPSSAAKPEPPMLSDALVAQPGAVRVAMLPSVRGGLPGSVSPPTIVVPYIPAPVVKARLTKCTVPATGKVRVRDLFRDLGGILFWDPFTRTVTACAGRLKLEMQIGSNVVKVNGKEMLISSAPTIVNGRAIIDAGIYHQACAMLASSKLSRSASSR